MEYDKVTGWHQRKPKVGPIVKVEAQLSRIAHSYFKLKCPIIRPATVDAITDSGERTTVAHILSRNIVCPHNFCKIF